MRKRRIHVLNNWSGCPGGWRHRRFWLNVERLAAWASITVLGVTFVWQLRAA